MRNSSLEVRAFDASSDVRVLDAKQDSNGGNLKKRARNKLISFQIS